MIVLNRPGVAFVRSSSVSLAAIAAATDARTALDFSQARAVANTRVSREAVAAPMQWFIGKEFGYATVAGSRALNILPLQEFKSALVRAQATHENEPAR